MSRTNVSCLVVVFGLCVLMMSVSGCTFRTKLPLGVDLPTQPSLYDGKYASDPRFQRAMADLFSLRAEAIELVHAKLGLTPKDATRITIKVRDALPAEPERLERFRDAPFQTRQRVADPSEVEILLHTEFLVNGRYNLAEQIRHEMVHAVLRERIPLPRYREIPKWLQEGLAVWCADQAADRVLYLFRLPNTPKEIEKVVVGLERGDHSFNRYAEYGLALDYLVSRAGEKAPRQLVNLLVGGTPAHDAIAQVMKVSWSEFKSGARQYALRRFEDLKPPGWAGYRDIVRLNRAKNYTAVRQLADAWLQERPQSPLRGEMLYYHGKASWHLGDHEAAERSLKAVIDDYSDSGLSDDAVVRLASSYLRTGRAREALPVLDRVLRDTPDSHSLEQALFQRMLAWSQLKQFEEARRSVELFERSFPSSRLRPSVQRLSQTVEALEAARLARESSLMRSN